MTRMPSLRIKSAALPRAFIGILLEVGAVTLPATRLGCSSCRESETASGVGVAAATGPATAELVATHSISIRWRRITAASAPRNSAMRPVVPTKSIGGETEVLARSVAGTRHEYGPIVLPVETVMLAT